MVVCTISGTSVHVHKVAYCSTEGTFKPSPSKARTRTICSNSMIVYRTEVRRYVISNVITFVSYLTFVLTNNKYESTFVLPEVHRASSRTCTTLYSRPYIRRCSIVKID